MVYYDTCGIYVQSATSLQDKLTKINAIIDVLYSSALNAAGNNDITEYSLDDGQVKIRTVYRDSGQIMKSIDVLERQKQSVLNQLNGRITRHIDSDNFRRFNNGR